MLTRDYRESLTTTLLKASLRLDEFEHMLDPASGLLRVAQDEFNLIAARVEAGAAGQPPPGRKGRTGDCPASGRAGSDAGRTYPTDQAHGCRRDVSIMRGPESVQPRKSVLVTDPYHPQGPDSLIGQLELQQTRCVLLSTSAAEEPERRVDLFTLLATPAPKSRPEEARRLRPSFQNSKSAT